MWYSWQKSRSTTAYVRECFSKSIVLGTVDDPLVAKPYCDPLDISENSISRVTACLCETDLCNAFRSASEKIPSRVNQQSSEPKRKNPPSSKSNRRQQENDTQRNSDGESNSQRNTDQGSNSQRNSNQKSNSNRNRELMKLLAVQQFLKDQVLDKYSIQTKLACSVIHVGACSTQMLNVKHLVEPTFYKLRHV